jgi:hypothetical protein
VVAILLLLLARLLIAQMCETYFKNLWHNYFFLSLLCESLCITRAVGRCPPIWESNTHLEIALLY